MHDFSACDLGQRRQQEGHRETSDRVDRKSIAAPCLTIGEARILFTRRAKHVI